MALRTLHHHGEGQARTARAHGTTGPVRMMMILIVASHHDTEEAMKTKNLRAVPRVTAREGHMTIPSLLVAVNGIRTTTCLEASLRDAMKIPEGADVPSMPTRIPSRNMSAHAGEKSLADTMTATVPTDPVGRLRTTTMIEAIVQMDVTVGKIVIETDTEMMTDADVTIDTVTTTMIITDATAAAAASARAGRIWTLVT